MTTPNLFRYFRNSRGIIRLVVMMYIRFPVSLRFVEDLLNERGIEVSYESARFSPSRRQIGSTRFTFTAQPTLLQGQPCRRSRRVAGSLRRIRDNYSGLVETGSNWSDSTATRLEGMVPGEDHAPAGGPPTL